MFDFSFTEIQFMNLSSSLFDNVSLCKYPNKLSMEPIRFVFKCQLYDGVEIDYKLELLINMSSIQKSAIFGNPLTSLSLNP